MGATITKVDLDADDDGMLYDYETAHAACLNPNVNDAALDPDGDGASNFTESAEDTEPCTDSDTDDDGLGDAYEGAHACIDGLVPDSGADPDGDTLTNAQEQQFNGNPCGPTAGIHLELDATYDGTGDPLDDPSGWCEPVDPLGEAIEGQPHFVGVCLSNFPDNTLDALELQVSYDAALNDAPEVADVDPAVDDNPNANDGDAPGGERLGSGWDCTKFGFEYPQGDTALAGGDAFIACNADLGNPDRDLRMNQDGDGTSGDDSALLAVVEYDALVDGTDVLNFGASSSIAGTSPVTDGTCGAAAPVIPCIGAIITKLADGDLDGMPDNYEAAHTCLDAGTADASVDDEPDGLTNIQEFGLGTEPCDEDTDNDGANDGPEVAAGTDPLDPDSDDDGFTDGAEDTLGTDPLDADTDDDGLLDGSEPGLGTNPLDADTDDDGLSDGAEIATGTNPLNPDTDGDVSPDGTDNCALLSNPGQQNFDGDGVVTGPGIGNGSSVAGNDGSVPNADRNGDACDTDDDNDGLPDGSDPEPRGDHTYDDNNNGIPATGCLGGSDAADDGTSWDTNCDGVRDGIAPLGSGDSDGDGLSDAEETRRWGTCPYGGATVGLLDCSTVPDTQDTDADGKGDCIEVYDTDGNGAALFPSDGLNAVKATLLTTSSFGKDGAFDFNGDDALLFPTDGLNGVKAALLPAFCTP
jgi:hypothetical protein